MFLMEVSGLLDMDIRKSAKTRLKNGATKADKVS